jgi:pilus assembly protein CpaE
MMSVTPERNLRVLAVPIGEAQHDVLSASLPEQDDVVDVTLLDAGPARVVEAATRGKSDVALIASNGRSDDAIEMVERLVRARPDLAVVVLQSGHVDGFVERALDAGAQDVLLAPETPDRVVLTLRKAHTRVARSRSSASTAVAEGRLIAITGPKGGSGKTMCSTNLAAALARSGRKTLLMDLDLEFGDCAIVLGLKPDRTIYDLASAGGSMDEEKLAGFVTRHEASGLDVLIGPARPDQADAVTSDIVEDIFAIARRMYEFIVVDSAPAFSSVVISTVDAADEVVLMASMDVASLKDARLGLDTLELMGRRRDDVRIVLNRAASKGGLSLGRVSEALERPIDLVIPSDAAVPNSYNNGEPLVTSQPKNNVSKAIAELVVSVSGREDQGRRGWRLRGGKKS